MTKLGLLIGINYINTPSKLSGCINDVDNMKHMLVKKLQYKSSNIKILSEKRGHYLPTKSNILHELRRLIKKAKYNKNIHELWFHYSGHGTYMTDKTKDEDDGKDEVLVPLDHKKRGYITDDLIHKLVSELPNRCKMIMIFDCCHSGTMVDLKYRYISGKKNVIENKRSHISSNIFMISGCKDVQTSADSYNILNNNKWSGAMTSSFLYVLNKYGYNLTCYKTLKYMREFLKHRGYKQIPQMCCSHKLNTSSVLLSLRNKKEFVIPGCKGDNIDYYEEDNGDCEEDNSESKEKNSHFECENSDCNGENSHFEGDNSDCEENNSDCKEENSHFKRDTGDYEEKN